MEQKALLDKYRKKSKKYGTFQIDTESKSTQISQRNASPSPNQKKDMNIVKTELQDLKDSHSKLYQLIQESMMIKGS